MVVFLYLYSNLKIVFIPLSGEWSFEEPSSKLFTGDIGLVLKVVISYLFIYFADFQLTSQ